jgi:putative membrane protein
MNPHETNVRYTMTPPGLARKVMVLAIFAAQAVYLQQAPTVSHGDSAFLKEAAEGGLDEVKLGNLAQQRGAHERVKKFGQQMVEDHTQMNSELQALAARKNVILPSDISVREKASYKLLSDKSGDEFDKAYISSMVKDHQQDVAAFQKEAGAGVDADLKALASKALATLQEHLRMAQDIARELGVK